ncbi:MAG: hypothetical protein R2715_00640 [Ilumatobacteraceae bacterium]
MSIATILALSWKPELRGIIVVMIGFVVLCGSVYLIVGSNVGARLGFLVAASGLVGWLFVMGVIWWIYGIGLKGREPSWKPADPVAIVNDGDLVSAGILNTGDPLQEGYVRLADEDPKRGQAVASADEILQSTDTFAAGEYTALAVYDKGGERYPKLGDSIDFLAFRHKPRYALVEVQPVIPVLTEPGRAPLTPAIDASQPKTYVLMIRDLGSRRQPSIVLTIGSGIILAILCWLMNRRDDLVVANRSGKLVKAPAGA